MEVGSSSLPGTTSDILISDLVRLGGLAQLARAPALQAGGQRFESVILHDRCRPLCIVHFELCIEEFFDIL